MDGKELGCLPGWGDGADAPLHPSGWTTWCQGAAGPSPWIRMESKNSLWKQRKIPLEKSTEDISGLKFPQKVVPALPNPILLQIPISLWTLPPISSPGLMSSSFGRFQNPSRRQPAPSKSLAPAKSPPLDPICRTPLYQWGHWGAVPARC